MLYNIDTLLWQCILYNFFTDEGNSDAVLSQYADDTMEGAHEQRGRFKRNGKKNDIRDGIR